MGDESRILECLLHVVCLWLLPHGMAAALHLQIHMIFFQPTSSTAKLIAKRKSQQGDKGTGSNRPAGAGRYGQTAAASASAPSGMYFRPRRPKSCKYDSYRLRSRTSVVEENLFGEPLKNKLMARSKSMEALAMANAGKATARLSQFWLSPKLRRQTSFGKCDYLNRLSDICTKSFESVIW